MPLVFIKDIDTDTRLGLWKIADDFMLMRFVRKWYVRN